MKTNLILGASTLLAVPSAVSATCAGQGPHNPATLKEICDLERERGQSLVSSDVSVAQRTLADDFIGIDTKGKLYGKAVEIGYVSTTSQRFASDVMGDVIVRFYGSTAIAQGSDS